MENQNKITNTNNNNNTNNVNVNVKVEHPKRKSSQAKPKSKPQPNWVTKAIVVGIIGLTLSLLGYYLKSTYGKHPSPSVEHGEAPVTGTQLN